MRGTRKIKEEKKGVPHGTTIRKGKKKKKKKKKKREGNKKRK